MSQDVPKYARPKVHRKPGVRDKEKGEELGWSLRGWKLGNINKEETPHDKVSIRGTE